MNLKFLPQQTHDISSPPKQFYINWSTTTLYMNLFLENPKNIDAILQQKLSTKTCHIMTLLHRSTHKDSKTSSFATL